MYKQISKECLTDVILENFDFGKHLTNELVETIWAAMDEVKLTSLEPPWMPMKQRNEMFK